MKTEEGKSMEKGIWIFWRWKEKGGFKTWSKSYVQEVIDCQGDKLIELADYEFHSKYPTRISLIDIEYKISNQ